MIKDLKWNSHLRYRQDESLTRTILNLVLVNRLQHLADKKADQQLSLQAEVIIDVRAKENTEFKSSLLIRGKADWVLGHGPSKAVTEAILVVVAKAFRKAETGLAQLLVYMCGIWEARKSEINRGVFGLLSDSHHYTFAYLSTTKQFYFGPNLAWDLNCGEIIFYLDNILRDAIHLSPTTTPSRHGNNILCQYAKYLDDRWQFGKHEEEGDTSGIGESDRDRKRRETSDKDLTVDIVEINGEARVVSHREPWKVLFQEIKSRATSQQPSVLSL